MLVEGLLRAPRVPLPGSSNNSPNADGAVRTSAQGRGIRAQSSMETRGRGEGMGDMLWLACGMTWAVWIRRCERVRGEVGGWVGGSCRGG